MRKPRIQSSLGFLILHTSYFILHLKGVLPYFLPCSLEAFFSRLALPSLTFLSKKSCSLQPARNQKKLFLPRIRAPNAHCIGIVGRAYFQTPRVERPPRFVARAPTLPPKVSLRSKAVRQPPLPSRRPDLRARK